MPGIDQILSVVVKQGANELRLATDQEPCVLNNGARVRFTMAATSNAVLRQLLGGILSVERELELSEKRRITFDYQLQSVGQFKVSVARRGADELDIVFAHTAVGARSNSELSPAQPSVANRQVPAPSAPGPVRTDGRVPCTVSPGAMSSATVQSTRLLEELIERARQARASDVHLSDGEAPYLRVDGRLLSLEDFPRIVVTDAFEMDEAVLDAVGRGVAHECALQLATRERIRLSIYRAEAGLAAAVRILPQSAPKLDSLEFPVPLQFVAEEPHGLVLFCGATGQENRPALRRCAASRSSVVLCSSSRWRIRSSSHYVGRPNRSCDSGK
jgi:twitching motility protein PilT